MKQPLDRKVKICTPAGCIALTLCLAAAALPADAQIRIGLKLEHRTVLQFEPIRAFITVYNDSSEILSVSDEAGKEFDLRFVVEESNGTPVRQTGEAPVCRRLMILPGSNQAMMRNVTDWCRMLGLKHYRIVAEAVWRGDRYVSNPVTVNVVSGLALTEVTRVLPDYGGRIRRYGLRYWKRDQYEHLFLRVDEETGGVSMNYGVVDLGRLIRVYEPELTVDADGIVRVSHQSGRRCFTRTVFRSDHDRLRFVDQTYHLPNGDPYPRIRDSEKTKPSVSSSTNRNETAER